MTDPTIAQTHEARRIYMDGMAANYPGVDPRMSLLGMKEGGATYQTVGYGNQLVPVPSRLGRFTRALFEGLGIGAIIVVAVRYFWG